MAPQEEEEIPPTPTSQLSVWDSVSIIVGIVIGAGIYETAPLILQQVSSPGMALGVWALGGVLSLIGALCYSELASTYPRSGGDYVYLTRAYGQWAGFLFGWSQLAVLMTGSIGMMAFIFANYAMKLWNLGPTSEYFFAVTAVVLLTLTNLFGVVFGKRTQNLLTLLKVMGIGGILLVGFLWPHPGASVLPSSTATGTASLGLAFILVLYTYGGWNDAAFVVAEMKDKRRNIPKALMLGTLSLVIIYLLINAAYMLGLGFDGARQSRAIAADLLQRLLGDFGATAMSLLVMISALGAVNGLIYTGSRIYSTLGEDFRMFSMLSRRNLKSQAPVWSLAAQGLITIGLITLVGTTFGRNTLNATFEAVGWTTIAWEGHGGFGTLLRCTAPIFWLFFLLSAFSLFVLRRKDSSLQRPFSVPFYPFLPLVFCATCAYMFYSATKYAGTLILIGIFPLVLGFLLYAISRNLPTTHPLPGRGGLRNTNPAHNKGSL